MIRRIYSGICLAALMTAITIAVIGCTYFVSSGSGDKADTKAPQAAITWPADLFTTALPRLVVQGTAQDKETVASVTVAGCRDGDTPVVGSICYPQMIYGGVQLLGGNTINPALAQSTSGDFDTWEAELTLIGVPGEVNIFTIKAATMDRSGNYNMNAAAIEVDLDLQSPDTTPPDLTIVSPIEDQVIGVGEVVVTGIALDPSGIGSVILNPGNVEATVLGLIETYWYGTVALAAGENVIRVTVTDGLANERTDQVTVISGLTPNMVLVHTPQTVTLGYNTGAATEAPEHRVELSDYYVDKFEATNIDYKACYDSGWCWEVPSGLDFDVDYWQQGILMPLPGHETLPLVNVTWDASFNYCMWMNKRLPTEAEWERAARAGAGADNMPDGRLYSFGSLSDCPGGDCSGLANIMGDHILPVPVGSYPSNPLGIYDLTGNVMEWVWDFYQDDFYDVLFAGQPVLNPLMDTVDNVTCQNLPAGFEFLCHVNRGGAYTTSAQISRATFRNYYDDPGLYDQFGNLIPPSGLDMVIGFRCAMDAQ